jgi:hypothetical protein
MKGTHFALFAALSAAVLGAPVRAAEPNDDLKEAVKRLEASNKLLVAEIEKLNATIKSLEGSVNQLKVAAAPDTTSKRETTDAKSAFVNLRNDYSEQMSIIVNDRVYRLAPGQSRQVAVTPGKFTYQVLQLQRTPQERTIEPGEQKPIRIYTQYPPVFPEF